ncbi:hypothetical protein [Thermococcus sp. 9N3]|uniref:hypothetical protein n=1 Tax=Thermococcus sp. 9N3 TaxID=163002 RepID=UPI00142FBB40|nr:hypothetical protein [Thermococcus sp. 9N3]NJE49668.1 hypothetical protein [Thermococcus sp. 9N3]
MVRRESQKRFDGREFGRMFLVLLFVNLFMFTVVESLLKGDGLVEGLWLFLKVLPWWILMVFLVALSLDKSLLFDDDEEDSELEVFE